MTKFVRSFVEDENKKIWGTDPIDGNRLFMAQLIDAVHLIDRKVILVSPSSDCAVDNLRSVGFFEGADDEDSIFILTELDALSVVEI